MKKISFAAMMNMMCMCPGIPDFSAGKTDAVEFQF